MRLLAATFGRGFGFALALVLGMIGPSAHAYTSEILYAFTRTGDGGFPAGGLVSDSAGALYGKTDSTVFKLDPVTKVLATLYTFTGVSLNGVNTGGLVFDSTGALYGMTPTTVFKLTPPSGGGTPWIETTLHTFKGKDGQQPLGGLTIDTSGTLYGTTGAGGLGYGVVFKLTPPEPGLSKWKETVLHRFRGQEDGKYPFSGLLLDSSGALYGTTSRGGYTSACGFETCGVVFKLLPPEPGKTIWREAILHKFGGGDGKLPQGGLIMDASGVLYGTTLLGGTTSTSGWNGQGLVFSLSPPVPGKTVWRETVLYNFQGAMDGGQPRTTLTMDGSGVLYGSTTAGGNPTYCGSYQCGVVFKIPSGGTGQRETVIHRFAARGNQVSGLLLGPSGVLYGTMTLNGGQSAACPNGCGTVFKLTP